MEVSNTNLAVLEYIRDELQAGKIRNITYYPSRRDHTKWKPAYILSWHSDQGRKVAALLQPHLRIKAEQAEVLTEWPNKRIGGSGRDLETHAEQQGLYEYMKELNHRGI